MESLGRSCSLCHFEFSFLSPFACLLATVSQGGRDDRSTSKKIIIKGLYKFIRSSLIAYRSPKAEHILSHSEHDLTENAPKNCQKNVVIGLNHKT